MSDEVVEASDEEVLRVAAAMAVRWRRALDLLGNDWGPRGAEPSAGHPEGTSVAHQIPASGEPEMV